MTTEPRPTSFLVQNARLVFPDRIEPKGDLRVVDGKIASVAPALSPEPGETVLDAAGRYLAPGFIDIHLHGALGRDAMEATPEAFETICRFHASGGTTALALATITAPTDAIVNVLRTAQAYRQTPHAGAQLLGIHVEGPYFSPQKPGAHRLELIRNPTPADYEPLLPFGEGDGRVMLQMTLAPELPGALELIDRLRRRGVRVSGGHSDAWDEEACAAFTHGMEGATHTFNCMSGARRRGPYRVAGLLEYVLSEPGIVCELIADGHHVAPTLMRMLRAAKGQDGVILVTDASAGAGLEKGKPFLLGDVECVAGEGICLTADGTALAGSAATMAGLVRTMVAEVDVPLAEAIRMATLNPARALRLDHRKGVLTRGTDADLVLLDEALQVERTWVAGRLEYQRGSVSAGKEVSS
ncbi:MAG TPA: N-acetylglucosamine-6-phosphate deacetylase [Chthoniobacteraceae bacterium]|nr:N-acetylglucosamine-6-phosphate deacetylase [Chthoniobacteraceae bacterium]